MSKDKLKKILKIIITILIIIQPIIDIIRTNIVNDIQFLGFSLFELINMVLVMGCAIIAIIITDKRKRLYKYIIYVVLFGIYFALHCYNISLFNNSVYPKQTKNYLVEAYYLYRTFINPLILMISLYYVEVEKKYLIKVIEIYALVISSIIIVCNVFHIGANTYGEGMCKLSFIDWIGFVPKTKNYFYLLTCKGVFSSGNQLSSISFMILPIVLYAVYKYRKILDYITLICLIIAMYSIGTKVSTLGVIAVFVAFFIIYIFFYIFNKVIDNKDKLNNIRIIIIIAIVSFALFFISPRYYGLSMESGDVSSIDNIELSLEGNIDYDAKMFKKEWKIIKKTDCFNMDGESLNKFLEFFNKYKDYMGVSSFILKAYDVEDHPVLWCDYLEHSKSNDYRILKTAILKNIYEENNNDLDKYLGMGYTLNYIYTESDYSYQYYSYGIFGMILFILPYFIISIYVLINFLINYKKKFNFENILLLISPFIALCTAYYSGHVLERTVPLLVLSMICGINLISTKEDNNNKVKKK